MKIKITTEYVTLGQFLKLADIISSGGEAKFAVKEMDIYDKIDIFKALNSLKDSTTISYDNALKELGLDGDAM
mgnify:CR=1 FL=1